MFQFQLLNPEKPLNGVFQDWFQLVFHDGLEFGFHPEFQVGFQFEGELVGKLVGKLLPNPDHGVEFVFQFHAPGNDEKVLPQLLLGVFQLDGNPPEKPWVENGDANGVLNMWCFL